MDYEIDLIDLSFITVEEITTDLKTVFKLAEQVYPSPETIIGNEALQKTAEGIYGDINSRFNIVYDYSSQNTSYIFLPDKIDGVTSFENYPQKETTIGINKALQCDAAMVRYVLAHEAVHAAAHDPSEWLEEMVALDYAYNCVKNNNDTNMQCQILKVRFKQLIDALCFKMRDDGYSEDDIADTLQTTLGLDTGQVQKYADVDIVEQLEMKDGTIIESISHYGCLEDIKAQARYQSVPYFKEKRIEKQLDTLPKVEINGQITEVRLNYLISSLQEE